MTSTYLLLSWLQEEWSKIYFVWIHDAYFLPLKPFLFVILSLFKNWVMKSYLHICGMTCLSSCHWYHSPWCCKFLAWQAINIYMLISLNGKNHRSMPMVFVVVDYVHSVIAIVNVANVCYCWNVVKTPCAQFNDTCRTFEGKFPLVKDFCFWSWSGRVQNLEFWVPVGDC